MTNKEEKEREKRRLTYGIPKGAPKAVKVFSLTKEGREFLEKLWEAFPKLRPRPTNLEESIPMTTDETVAHYIHEAVEAKSEPLITKIDKAATADVELIIGVEAQKKAEIQDMIHAQELAKAATEARKAKSEE